MEFEMLIDGILCKLLLEKKGDHFLVTDGKNTYDADIQHISPHIISIVVGSKSSLVYIARDKEKRYMSLGGQQFIVQEPSSEENDFLGGGESSQEDLLIIKAPMPGKVIKLNVCENDKVRKNQTLAIVEAMKMENEIKSAIDGTVKKIFASPGDLVDSEKPLIELEQ